MTGLHWYIITINVAAFVIYTIDFQIYVHGGEGIKPQVLCNLATICGGAFGTLIAEVLWDRKINKVNAQSRIYTLVWLVLQVAVIWAMLGPNHEKAKEFVQSFYGGHKFLCVYYVAINTLTFAMFALDKIKAMLNRWRIREIALLGLCLIGGGAGGMLAMDLCNHKVNSMHFMVGVPMMICIHLVLLICVAIGVF